MTWRFCVCEGVSLCACVFVCGCVCQVPSVPDCLCGVCLCGCLSVCVGECVWVLIDAGIWFGIYMFMALCGYRFVFAWILVCVCVGVIVDGCILVRRGTEGQNLPSPTGRQTNFCRISRLP